MIPQIAALQKKTTAATQCIKTTTRPIQYTELYEVLQNTEYIKSERNITTAVKEEQGTSRSKTTMKIKSAPDEYRQTWYLEEQNLKI